MDITTLNTLCGSITVYLVSGGGNLVASEYVHVIGSGNDALLRDLSADICEDTSINLLLSKGFIRGQGGTFSDSVWSNGTLFIKYFNVNKYMTNPLLQNFFDYSLYEKAVGFSLLPAMYGYTPKKFVVLQHIEGVTLNKNTSIYLEDTEIELLASDLYTQIYSLYKSTGYVIDDVDCNNIMYNPDSKRFWLVDLSAVAVFSVAYFAREYIMQRLLRLVNGFYSRGWISGFGLAKAEAAIKLLASDPSNR